MKRLPYQLTSTLRGVLAQRLLRTVAPAHTPEAGEPKIGGGYAGRIACGHFVELTPALRQAILDQADAETLSDPAICPGSLRQDALRLVRAGQTTEDELRRVLGA